MSNEPQNESSPIWRHAGRIHSYALKAPAGVNSVACDLCKHTVDETVWVKGRKIIGTFT
jgi:hypothetical protein